MTERLRLSQVTSFLSAFIIVYIMMFLVTRNFLLAFLSMIPNIYPVVVTLGIMGWFGIPLDVATVMIASITLGIAVDDTIHTVTWFRRNVEAGLDVRSSVIKTYTDVGKPIIITSIILILGFLVFVMGGILPTRTFGYLTAFSMLTAASADILFLPPLLLLFRKRLAKIRKDGPVNEVDR
jgi:predicted RND superfamily exporter protein